MKRSTQPPLWLLFGAGGMLSALVGWMLVLITGIAAPLNLYSAGALTSYANVAAFARNPMGKVFILAVVSLFLWHAGHRIYHTLHDLGVHPGPLAWVGCYGVALAGTAMGAIALVLIGF